jgi:regulator of replication initiation timing
MKESASKIEENNNLALENNEMLKTLMQKMSQIDKFIALKEAIPQSPEPESARNYWEKNILEGLEVKYNSTH